MSFAGPEKVTPSNTDLCMSSVCRKCFVSFWQTPRTTMGGGYRLKSPRSCRSADQSNPLQVGPPHRIRADSSPRPPEASGAQQHVAAPSRQNLTRSSQHLRADKDDEKRREHEAAEIERAYIHNLQKQVYFLELELESTKLQQVQRNDGDASEKQGKSEDLALVIEGLKTKISTIEQRCV